MRVVRYSRYLYGIRSSFDEDLRDVAKSTPGMSWSPGRKAWVGYPDAVMVTASRLQHERAKSIDVRALPKPSASKPPSPGIPVSYKGARDYQRAGIDFLVSQGPTGALLADDLGLGKSLQALRAARAFRMKTVIVCPSYALGVWCRSLKPPVGHVGKWYAGEVAKWWPAAWPVSAPEGTRQASPIVRATKKQIAAANGLPMLKNRDGNWRGIHADSWVVVLHYEVIHAWVETLIAWGVELLILDEAHQLQTPNSRRSLACREIRQHCRVAIALTGTPMTNFVKDLWNVVNVISPERFGRTFFDYGVRHCDGHQVQVSAEKVVWQWGGRSRLDELNARLQYFMLRRLKRDVALELPPKRREILDVEVPAKARISAPLEAFKKSKQVRRLLDLAANAKLPRVLELVADHATSGRRVVCFTFRRNVAEWLCNELALKEIPANYIHGGVSRRNRDRRIDEARAGGRAGKTGKTAGTGKKSSGRDSARGHVLCATIDTTAAGIDLTYADVAVFSEFVWEPWKLLQAEGRLHRYGQDAIEVLIQYVIARGTTDEILVSHVLDKIDTIDAAVGPTGETLRDDLDSKEKGEAALQSLFEAVQKTLKAT